MPAPVYACFWYDTEDYVTPASDDAARRLAELHARLDLPATFKLVGEKARRLRERGRTDVIRALRYHDIGYHTDFHSVPPTIAEYCEALPWREAVARFRRQETPGFEDVEAIIGRRPVTYGQPGGSWAPHVCPVLREWGITTYVDEGPWVGLDGAPFWFMGVLHVMRMGVNKTRFRLTVPGDELDGAVRFSVIARRLQERGGVISLGFHPCEWATDKFWDAVNFAGGRDPTWDELQPAPEPPPEEVERRFAAMEIYLRGVQESGVRAIGCSDLRRLYPDRARARWIGCEEVIELTAEWEDSVDYVALDGGWLSAAELLTVVAGLLRPDEVLGPGARNRVAAPLYTDGPQDDVAPLDRAVLASFDDLIEAAHALLVRSYPRGYALPPRCETGIGHNIQARSLPSRIPIGDIEVRPEEFLMGCLRALRTCATARWRPETVELTPTEFLPARHVAAGSDLFTWPIFPPGFHAPSIMAHARRQAWTLKPATLTAHAGG